MSLIVLNCAPGTQIISVRGKSGGVVVCFSWLSPMITVLVVVCRVSVCGVSLGVFFLGVLVLGIMRAFVVPV